jgi:hypothetical protein
MKASGIRFQASVLGGETAHRHKDRLRTDGFGSRAKATSPAKNLKPDA